MIAWPCSHIFPFKFCLFALGQFPSFHFWNQTISQILCGFRNQSSRKGVPIGDAITTSMPYLMARLEVLSMISIIGANNSCIVRNSALANFALEFRIPVVMVYA